MPAVAKVHARGTRDSRKKCFHSGSSLSSAFLSNDRFPFLNDVREIRRIFDLGTGSIVTKWSASQPCLR